MSRLIDADDLYKKIESYAKLADNRVRSAVSADRVYKAVCNTQSTERHSFLDMLDIAPTVDAAPVVHAHWIYTKKHLWKRYADGTIDTWAWDHEYHNGPCCEVCGASPCVNCMPNWEDCECKVGHYVCSNCNATSAKGTENFCPNCGAKMDEEAK